MTRKTSIPGKCEKGESSATHAYREKYFGFFR